MVIRPSATTALVEPGAPMWAQRMVLKMLEYFAPMALRQPMPVWASTKANLPPASDYPNCLVYVSDQGGLGLSVNGAWVKITPGGPV
jgi:hypothetical protein